MKTHSMKRMVLASLLAASPALAQETSETPPPAPVRRAELIDRQLDVSLEARDIERILGKIKKASDLAKERITEAAQTTEGVTGALERGAPEEARAEAEKAEAMMKEIIKQLEALLEEETPEKVRAAQKLAERIAELERQFAQQFPGSLNSTSKSGKSKVDPNSMKEGQAKEKPQSQGEGGTSQEKMENKAGSGGEEKKPEEQKDEEKSEGSEGQKTEEEKDGSGEMTDEERREALAEQAEQLAETGATLQDVLKAIMQSTDPADQDAIRKVEAILKEADFEKAIASMQQAADQIRSGELDDARLGGLDVADRMEIMSQRLDAAYQLIVAPRAEELRKLEEALAIMRERLESLETESQVIAWHREARQLLERIEELGVDTEVRDQLLEMMKQVGIGDSDITDWAVVSGRYVPPEQYGAALVKLQEDIQRRLQTLLLGDIETGSDEATPTKYKELVERYYEVLSRETTARNDKS